MALSLEVLGQHLANCPKGPLNDKSNKRNYKFSPKDVLEIIDWINANLLINWVPFNDDIPMVETDLIETYKPILNIAKNPLAMPELARLRAECVRVVNL